MIRDSLDFYGLLLVEAAIVFDWRAHDVGLVGDLAIQHCILCAFPDFDPGRRLAPAGKLLLSANENRR